MMTSYKEKVLFNVQRNKKRSFFSKNNEKNYRFSLKIPSLIQCVNYLSKIKILLKEPIILISHTFTAIQDSVAKLH